jgi:hypothetical protein
MIRADRLRNFLQVPLQARSFAASQNIAPLLPQNAN